MNGLILKHLRRSLAISLASFVVVACGDEDKTATLGADTTAVVDSDTTVVPDGESSQSDTTSSDTATVEDTAAAEVTVVEVTATDDTTTPQDVGADAVAPGGTCAGSGPCSALSVAGCGLADACDLDSAESCQVTPCHLENGKTACGMKMPACVWNEEFQTCKYSPDVNCATMPSSAACQATGGCVVQTVAGPCTGGNWDCHTVATDGAGTYEANCQALVTAGFACTWTP